VPGNTRTANAIKVYALMIELFIFILFDVLNKKPDP